MVQSWSIDVRPDFRRLETEPQDFGLPIRYAARTYGETQISRFRHGVLLVKMVIFAFFKIKAI